MLFGKIPKVLVHRQTGTRTMRSKEMLIGKLSEKDGKNFPVRMQIKSQIPLECPLHARIRFGRYQLIQGFAIRYSNPRIGCPFRRKFQCVLCCKCAAFQDKILDFFHAGKSGFRAGMHGSQDIGCKWSSWRLNRPKEGRLLDKRSAFCEQRKK